MTKLERYDQYKEYHIAKNGTNNLRSFEQWEKYNNRRKRNKGFDSYALFAADFETTYHKEPTDSDILIENRATNADELSNDLYPENESYMFLSGVWDIKTNEYILCYENMVETFNAITQMTYKQKHRRAIVYFHNLAYDGSYILNWLIRHKYKQSLNIEEKTKQPLLKRKEYSLLLSGGKFFNLCFYWRGIKIFFIDSLKILPQSLASLGESIGYKKLSDTIDYKQFKLYKNHDYPKEWLTYLKRDCEILANIIKAFYIKEPRAQNIKSQTIGSISYKHIASLIKHNTQKINIKEFYDWLPWYRGGLCFCSLKYMGQWVHKPKLIKMIDATSMYPSQMIKPLPCGDWQTTIDPNWKTYCAFYKLNIKSAIIKKKYDDIAIIPNPYVWVNRVKKIKCITSEGLLVKNNYEYVQDIENEIYHFTDIELEVIKEIYNIEYDILETYYWETKPYLEQEIREMFIEKQQASRDKKETDKLIAKLKLNNLYGKLGQKPDRAQDFYGELKDIPKSYKVLGKKNTPTEAYNVILIKEDTQIARPVYLASYITSLARVNLINQYIHIIKNGGKFLYCDTDSICYIDNKTKPIVFDNIGDDLGNWEYETIKDKKEPDFGKILKGDGFCCLCPKQYRIVRYKKVTPLKFASAGTDKGIIGVIKNQHYKYDMTSNSLYHIYKKKLTNSKFGKIIDEKAPFSFKKWNNIIKMGECPKELYN